MKQHLKDILLFVYLSFGYAWYLDRLKDLGFSIAGTIYTILFFLVTLAIFCTSYIRSTKLRYSLATLFLFSAVFSDSYQRITANLLTYDSFITLLNSTAFAEEAIEQYFVPIAQSMVPGLILFTGLLLKPGRFHRIHGLFFVTTPFIIIGLLTTALFLRGGNGAKGLPTVLTPIVYSNLAFYEFLNNEIGSRKHVTLPQSTKVSTKDIILIIDESISASYLDINSHDGAFTNLNEKQAFINIFNYGVAASITNCSYGTNLTLRYGGTRDRYQSINSTMPSIWEYAKQADYRTIYIDSQRAFGQLHNGMTEIEVGNIDKFIQFDDTPVLYRDIEAANSLVNYINNKSQEFIIVNKIGAHFPVHDKFPDQFAFYEPMLPRGNFVGISDTGSREGFSGSSTDWVLYRNSYKNTILWNVGHFFSKIIEAADLNKATIIYTADHGQDLHKRGNPGLSTHCNPDPVADEGAVPLVIIEGKKNKTLNWQKYLQSNKNNSSHYNIFSTILTLMSYDETRVKLIYGNSLHNETNDEYTFNTRFNARLGKKSVWKKLQ
ncbi:MAG: sulfatase-like hydrolase/transferase [Gammaproteobacteria bacterium]|nr:sulfatase-like hydrolase/transferase [Gammaproteobacteria bacterium]